MFCTCCSVRVFQPPQQTQGLTTHAILALGLKVHKYLALGFKIYAYLALGCSQFCISYLCIFKNIYFISLHPYVGFHLTIKFWPNLVVC